MLTVNHICPNNASIIRTCESVSHHYRHPDGDTVGECVCLHGVDGPEGNSFWLWDGRVYVMNDNGKTVATYYLSDLEAIPYASAKENR